MPFPATMDTHWAIPLELQVAFNRERRAARDAPPGTPAEARVATSDMYRRMARLQSEVIAREGVAVACRAGCSYCCHLRVEIRPHEAFLLAHHIATRCTPETRERLVGRITTTRRRLEALTPAEHIRAGIPCALLEDGRCSVYEARPAACRKYYSQSVDTCRNAFNDTSAPLTGELEHELVRLAGNGIALGHARGLEEAGRDASLYELHAALSEALANPRAAERYRRGKRAFVRAGPPVQGVVRDTRR